MAILGIVEQWEGRTCSKSLDKFNRKYTRRFRVTCDTANQDINVILGTSPLPVIGVDTYPTDSGAMCLTVQVNQNQKFFDLTYGYDSEVPVPSQQDPDPLSRPAIYSTSYQKVEFPMIEDLDGEAIINSADQPFEQPLTAPSSLLMIQIEKNYAISSMTLLDFGNLVDTINDAVWVTPFNDFPKWSCRMDSIEAKQMFENDIEYWQVNYKILYDPQLWFPVKVLDCGYAELDPITGELLQFEDGTGAKLSKPKLLDGAGGESTTAHYLDFDIYEEVSWSSVP